MKSNRAFLVLVAVVVAVLMASPVVEASNPLLKLGRGIANVAFGPLELPMKIYDVNREQGGIAAVTYGTFLGVAYVLAREGVGIVDILTFPSPLPGCTDDDRETGWGYGPMMRPEWVVDQQHNIYNIFYDDAPMQ